MQRFSFLGALVLTGAYMIGGPAWVGTLVRTGAYLLAPFALILVANDLFWNTTAPRQQVRHARLSWAAACAVVVSVVVALDNFWLQFVLMLAIAAWVLCVNRAFLGPLVLYLQENLIQAFLLVVFYLMTWGWLMALAGVPDLIWHEDWSRLFASAAAATMLLALFGVCAFYVGSYGQLTAAAIQGYYRTGISHRRLADWIAPRGEEGDIDLLSQFLWVTQLPFVLLLLVPAVFPRVFPYVPRLQWGPDWWCYLVTLLFWSWGVVTGVVLVKLALYAGNYLEVYTRPIAVALIDAVRTTYRVLADLRQWVSRASSTVWGRLVEAWNQSHHPAQFQTWLRAGLSDFVQRISNQVRAWWNGEQPAPLGVGHGVAAPQVEPADGEFESQLSSIRAVFSFVLVVAAFFVALNVLEVFGIWDVPPGVAIYAFLAFLVMVNALARILVPERLWYLRLPALVALVAWIALANRETDKLQYENLSYDESAKSPLVERVGSSYFSARPTAAGRKPLAADGLVDDGDARAAWLAQAPRPEGCDKPKLVVVCCSGGGARSLAWTTRVLDRLGREIEGFDRSVRLITAGSAGSVGAGYYVKMRYDQSALAPKPPKPWLERKNWVDRAPSDSETAVVQSVALREVWRMFDARPRRGAPPEDRGRVLEESWDDLRQVPFRELRAAERQGQVPSLVLAPVVLEDGRRMVISNLDLHNYVLSSGPELLFGGAVKREFAKLSDPADRRTHLAWIAAIESGGQLYGGAAQGDTVVTPGPGDVSRTNYSLSAVEFAHVFRRAGGFRLATAARMSAAFPVFTPAVYLPSRPPVRVVDSGYFDNYGVDLAAAWLFENRDWIKRETSGVLLVQVRAMGRREERTGMVPSWTGLGSRVFNGYQLFGSVMEGAVKAFSRGSIFRNDRELDWLSVLFNDRGDLQPPTDFFTTVVFESTAILHGLGTDWSPWEPPGRDRDGTFGALTWRLTGADSQSIVASLHEPATVALRKTDSISYIHSLQEKLDNPDKVREESEWAASTWRFEQAVNYERFVRLRQWWSQTHTYGGQLPRSQ
jgi:hypothetical protein